MPRKKVVKVKRDDFKRPNGQGTVYKMHGNRRRPWIARVTTKYRKRGKQEYQNIGYFKSEEEAEAALSLHQIQPVSPRAGMTLEELYSEWSAGKYEYISHDTINTYKAAWINFAKYKDVKVKEIRTGHFQSIIDQCYKENKSKSSLEKIRNVASAMLDYAIQNDITNKNYAKFIRIPKFEKAEKDRFSDLEIEKLFKAINKNEWISTVLIMIYTGMRISEMLQLTKFNVDLKDDVITGGIKSEAGKNRIIPIHTKIKPMVEKWYNKDGQALICHKEGKGMLAKYYREEYYYPALDTAGVRKLVPHVCRHTFASLMAEAGADPIFIQKVIGHADYSTTANIYTHLEKEKLKEAVNKI